MAESPRACEPCRNKKAKCDRGLPGCMKCFNGTRGPQECFYRKDCFDLMIHDDIQMIKRRYGGEQGRLSLTCTQEIPNRSYTKAHERELSDIPKPVITDLALQAGSNILLARFEHGVYYQYLPGIYSLFPTSRLLHMAVETVGLRCLSLARNEGRLLLKARENHAVALQIANQNITHLVDHHVSSLAFFTVPYDIIAAVLLLALFAVMSSNSQAAQEVWTKHVDGALAILITCQSQEDSMRSLSKAAQNLIGHVINCAELSHLQRRKCLPVEILRLCRYLPPDNIQARLYSIINGLGGSDTERLNMNEGLDSRVLQLYQLDAESSAILQQLQKAQPFRIVPNHTSQRTGPICHDYHSHRSAQMWNFVRVTRLMLNERVLVLLGDLAQSASDPGDAAIWRPLEIQTLRWQASSTIASLAFDIYASVPVWLRRRNDLEDHQDDSGICAPVSSDSLHWAHSLIWPLAVVQASAYTPKKLLALIDDNVQSLWQATTFPGATGPEKQRVGGMELKDWY